MTKSVKLGEGHVIGNMRELEGKQELILCSLLYAGIIF